MYRLRMADENVVIVENGEGEPIKTAKQLEKEAKKQAKLDKLKQKQDKLGKVAKKDGSEVTFIIITICFFTV